MTRPACSLRGFTLIEMIVVIVITGVIAGMVAVFIKGPVDSYFDMARRAELTDIADTAVRRMARDIRLALPNSVRNPVDGSDQCIEFMPTKSGGRYRAEQAAPTTPTCPGPVPCGDTLDFTTIDASFDMLGLNSSLPASSQITAGDVVVVYNDGSTGGNAYSGLNAVQIAAAGVGAGDTANTTKLSFVGAGATIFARKLFPSTSPANRFQVIPATEHVVAYVCSGAGTVGGNGTGILYRYARILAAAYPTPATCPAVPAGTPILAKNVSACSLKYEPPGSGSGAGRFGIVSISLTASQAGETVNLYHQVHVDNTP